MENIDITYIFSFKIMININIFNRYFINKMINNYKATFIKILIFLYK